jgi:hypothetical protein
MQSQESHWSISLYFVDFGGKNVFLQCKKKRHQHPHPRGLMFFTKGHKCNFTIVQDAWATVKHPSHLVL